MFTILLIAWLCTAQVPFWLYLLVAAGWAAGILGERRVKVVLESKANHNIPG